MSGFLAVVLLTYRESLRKKILLIFIIFCLGLIISSAFFPAVSSMARVKLVETWTFQTVTFFGILIAVFLAAVSIPGDIENKRLFMILTKPISKETIMLGRLVGFIITSALIILMMGLMGIGYIRAVTFFQPDAGAALHVRERIKSSEFFFQQNPPSEAEKDQTQGSIDGVYMDANYKKLEETRLAVALKGDKSNFAGWDFHELYKYKLTDDKLRAEIRLKASEGLGRVSTTIKVKIFNPTTHEEDSRKIEITYRKIEVIEFDRKYVDKIGDLRFYISRDNPDSTVTVDPESVILLSSPKSFEWNFLKGLSIIFLQIVLILVFCVTCSAFLSGPVNIFLNMFLYLCGSGMKFLQDSVETMKYSMLQEIKKEQLAVLANQVYIKPEGAIPIWLMNLSDMVLSAVLKIIPDFSRFDAWGNIMKGYAIENAAYGPLLGYLFIYSVIMLILGVIAFRLRDA